MTPDAAADLPGALPLVLLTLALLPAALAAINLPLYRPLPPAPAKTALPGVSLLIPARDEEANIGAAVAAALANRDVELEVVVLDDHSADRTAEIVRALAAEDPRVRLEPAPPLPPGWSGKQHACRVLADRARLPVLVFVDADVRLAPDALGRIAARLARDDVALLSGFPRQVTGSPLEKLVVPLIHLLLLGYLPMVGMKRTRLPAFGAGCGQLFAARADAYRAMGGHAAIRRSWHDGVTLPRAFRQAGFATDLFDATDAASCRMYRSAREVWDGFGKNATEGLATPIGLPVWTVLLGGGHILPPLLLALGPAVGAAPETLAAAGVATSAGLAMRLILALRFRQSLWGAVFHPAGVAVLLAIQWTAYVKARLGLSPVWRGRALSQ